MYMYIHVQCLIQAIIIIFMIFAFTKFSTFETFILPIMQPEIVWKQNIIIIIIIIFFIIFEVL